MAVTVEQLRVVLEAQIGPYQRGLAQGQAETNRRLTAMEARYARFASNLKNSSALAGSGILGLVGGLSAALGARQVIEYANAWTRVTRAVDGSGRVFGITLKSAQELNALANDARVDLEAYSKLYIRTSAAIRDYGFETGTAEKVTSTLAKALKLGGAAASEQASVLLQFSQALQKGKLDGDEFRSVMENAGIVQELLSKRLNVSKGEIINLARSGKLQIKDLVGAMVDGAEQVDRVYREMPQTIDEAFTVLRNTVVQFLGEADKATGASQAIVAGLQGIGNNLGAISVLAGAILGSATLRMVAFAAATVSAANPLTLIAAAIGGLATAYGVFGDEVKVSSDGVVSLKDALAGFLDVAGGDAESTISTLVDTVKAIQAEAGSAGLSFEGLADTVVSGAASIAQAAQKIDDRIGGIGSRIANAFIAANQYLAETVGLTQAAGSALDFFNRASERAEQIALRRGIENGPNLGQGLADALSGKKDFVFKGEPKVTDPNAKRSAFEREVDQIKKRTEALKAEIATIDQSTFAQEKAKAAAELRHAATVTAAKEGRAVTQTELDSIEKLSTAYGRLQAQAAFLNKLQAEEDGLRNLRMEVELAGLEGAALERARIEQELLNDARRAGIALTPEEEARIRLLADQKARLAEVRDIIVETNEVSKDALKGFISDLAQGTSAADALANALDKIADKLLDEGINQLFGSQGGLGSLVGGLFGFADGGVMVPGKGPVSLPRFARGGVSRSAAIFGEAGPEAAVPLPDGRRIPVDLRVPNIPTTTQAAAPAVTQVTLAPVFHVENGTPEGVEKMKGEIVPLISKVVHEMFDRSPRFARTKL